MLIILIITLVVLILLEIYFAIKLSNLVGKMINELNEQKSLGLEISWPLTSWSFDKVIGSYKTIFPKGKLLFQFRIVTVFMIVVFAAIAYIFLYQLRSVS